MSDFAPLQPTEVNSDTAGDQIYPNIATLSGGGSVVVWTNHSDTSSGTYAQVYDANGAKAGGPKLIFGDGALAAPATVSVAALSDGGYIVVGNGSGGSAAPLPLSNIWTQRMQADGSYGAFSSVASSAGANDSLAAAGIYAVPGGGYLVGIEHIHNDGTDGTLSVQRFDASGVPQGSQVQVGTFSEPKYVSMAVLANGDVVAASHTYGNGHDHVTWTQVNSSGAVVHTTALPADSSSAFASVVALANGNYMVLWDGMEGPNAWHAQLNDASGAAIGGVIDLPVPGTFAAPVKATALDDGNILLSWREVVQHVVQLTPSVPGYPITWELAAQEIDASGRAIGGVVKLTPDTTDINDQQWSVAATPDDGFMTATERRSSASGDDVFRQQWEAIANHVTGTASGDVLAGTSSNDLIMGLGGNDRLSANGGVDRLDGGAGVDTAMLDATAAGVLAVSQSGRDYTVTTAGGTQTLQNIERVLAADGLFALDTLPQDNVYPVPNPVGDTWAAAALFHAAFGTLPGIEDLSRWTAQADLAPQDMGALGQRMIDYYAPGISTADLVTHLYEQLTHTEPAAGDVQYWVNRVGSPPFETQGDLFAYAAILSLNTDAMVGFTGTVQPLDPAWFS